MREHEVPTHVQAEDKVLLGFTFPQIVAVTAVCAISYGAYRYAPVGPSEVRMGIAAVFGLVGIAMVVGKMGGRRLQTLWEVVGEDVDPSAVVCALSQHGAAGLPQDASGLFQTRAQASPFPSASDRGRSVSRSVRLPHTSFHVCGLFSLPSTGPDR